MRILLATDGSEHSEDAARFLTRFKFSPSDEIIVLHVISEIPYEDDVNAQIRHAIRKVAPKILFAAAGILKPAGVNILTLETDGYPDRVIIETAVEHGCSLIVMGARGVKGVKLLILGSSTRAVVMNASVPVLAVKNPGWRSEKMKILCATDGSGAAVEAAAYLASLPFPGDSDLVIFHVVPSLLPDIPEKYAAELGFPAVAGTAGELPGKSIHAFESARAALAGRFESIQEKQAFGDPVREILHAETVLKPDIIALGCRGLKGIRGAMGSVSRRLLRHSVSSVLIGKACSI